MKTSTNKTGLPKFAVCLFFLSLFFSTATFSQGTVISNFGTNPGNVDAWEYVPAGIDANAPLVVVMHGCTQSASGFASQTAWNTLADAHKFYVVHIGQKSANNSTSCFNYWEPGDHDRNQGEGLSIKQTVDYMKAHHSIDAGRVFATGLSAGGAFTVVMVSAYPDVFAAGAEMAGLPYKIATNATAVYMAAPGLVSKTPQQWGDLVRGQNPGFTGSYPRLAIFHGASDQTINKNNATETIKQFTNLHGADQTPDYTDNAFNGNSSVKLEKYYDAAGNTVVQYYSISGMTHGIAVDPGTCYQQGGTATSLSFDVNLSSTFWAAQFFGILRFPYAVSGLTQVGTGQQGVTYSVPNTGGSSYAWTVPAGATVVSGQGSNSITVNWGNKSGNVTVVESASSGCKIGPVDLSVSVGATATSVQSINGEGEEIFVTQTGEGIEFMMKSSVQKQYSIAVYDMSGRVVFAESGLNVNQYNTIKQDLTPGIYVLHGITPANNLVKKFMVR